MFKLLTIFATFLSGLNSSIPAPEIMATPIPYFDERNSADFVNPVSQRAPGHRGIDLKEMNGEMLLSPVAGRVSFVGKVFSRNVISIRTANELIVSFEPVCSTLQESEVVSAGQEIGRWCLQDETYQEHCPGCVHFSVRSARGYLNPLLFFGKLRPGVLLS